MSDVHPLPNIQVAPDDVETAARIAASRRTVVDFTSYTDPSYVAEPVHENRSHGGTSNCGQPRSKRAREAPRGRDDDGNGRGMVEV